MEILKKKNSIVLCSLFVLMELVACPMTGQAATYTLDADFDLGSLINVVHDPSDQLQIDDTTTPFDFIWVAVSSKGTVVKIDTLTGQVLGEYQTAPASDGNGNPSRTTVDKDGSVWVANRNVNNGGMGSVVHIGLFENGQWEDRNHNGICDTSTGLGDVKLWPSGDASMAADECIIHYTYVNSTGTRHVSVNANNDVWVSGTGGRNFDLISGGLGGGTIIRPEASVGYGGYGGLIDPSGVIWSARPLLRWDTINPLTGLNGDPAGPSIGPPVAGTNWSGQSGDSYGLGIDSSGNVWNTQLSGNIIRKYAPDGTLLGTYSHGDDNAQGCVAGLDDDIWVAHSLYTGKNTVGHIKNDGTFVGNVTLDPSTSAQPTGVAVDAAGKIWATGYNSQKVYRIDPAIGTAGAVDFISVDLGGNLYNYSDMTGSTLIGAPDNGTWTVVYNSGVVDEEWGKVSWTAYEPGDSSISVTAASSTNGITFTPDVSVSNGVAFSTVADGQYLKVSVSFARSTVGVSPILYDLTVLPANEPPVADAGSDQTVEQASYDGAEVTLDGSGSTDDGLMEPLTYTWEWTGGLATGVSPPVTFPLGTTTVTLTVDDGEFTDSDTVDITVQDTMPPTIELSEPDPSVLWAPNHKFVDVVIMGYALDICDADLAIEVSVNVIDAEGGDGGPNHDPDYEILAVSIEEGEISILVALRAERSGHGDGRIYEITATVTDDSGNTATDTVEVVVPHDQGKGKK